MDVPGIYDVHLALLNYRGTDTTGTYTGMLPGRDDLIDVRCRSRRIHLARVTHVQPGSRFPILATEIKTG